MLAVPADSVLAASSKTIPFHTFLWKIASRCNLNCSYCYVYNLADSEWRRQPPFMDLATARQAAVRTREHLVVHNKTSASIIFHGGEPLLAGRDGIEALLDTIGDAFRGSGIELSFGIQTNLLLFDVPIAELLRDRNVALGVSIDGPPAVNDALRVDRAGRGSSRELEEKLALLTSQRYRPIFSGFLSVIQPRSDAAAVIDYLASFRPPSMDFLLPLDNHDRLPPGMSAACGPSPYGRWLLRAFEHWLTLRPPIVVRTFNTIVALLCGAPSQVEHLGLTPVDLVVIETNGEIEGVDSLKGAFPGATQLGLNVFSHDFDQAAVHTEVLKRQHGRQDLCDTCRSCDVVEVCGAGYLPHRFSTARKFDNPSVYCADLYALIHRIREALIAELQSTSVQSASAASSDFQDNGFSTLDGMTAAHEPIVRLAQSTLAAHKGATVLDLGCGNGMLLREIARRTQAVPFGIEANPERAARAATLLGELGGTVAAGDLFSSTVIWSSGPYDLVIVPASALLEVPPVLLQSFKTSLAGGARLMLTYLYSDDVQKFGNLDSIARRTGLKLVGPQQGRASLAEIMIPVPASTET